MNDAVVRFGRVDSSVFGRKSGEGWPTARADFSRGLPVGVDGEVAVRPQLAAESRRREGKGDPEKKV